VHLTERMEGFGLPFGLVHQTNWSRVCDPDGMIDRKSEAPLPARNETAMDHRGKLAVLSVSDLDSQEEDCHAGNLSHGQERNRNEIITEYRRLSKLET
jgi:hypothetical protein